MGYTSRMSLLVRLCLLVCLLVSPLSALGAGFAKQSIFLSQSTVTEGESVLVHAVVANDAAAAFAGSLVIRDGDKKIGTVPVSLASGKAIAVSVSWEPPAGVRTVHADLLDSDGKQVETMSEAFTIKPKPEPAPNQSSAGSNSQSAATIESSKGIQDKIDDLSPAAGAAAAPVFTAIDSGRNAAADVLDNQLRIAGAKVGDVQGAQDERPDGSLPDTANGFWLALWTLYFYLLTVLRFLVGNAAVFYPVFALLFFYLLFKTFRRFRR